MKALNKTILSIVIGLIMSIVPLWSCINWTGGGHGTCLPFLLLYGPASLSIPLGYICLLFLLLIYPLYAKLLCRDLRLIFFILVMHYLGAFFAFLIFNSDNLIQYDLFIEYLFHLPSEYNAISIQAFIIKWIPVVSFFIYNLCAIIICMKVIYGSSGSCESGEHLEETRTPPSQHE